MKFTRRDFVKFGGMSAAAAIILPKFVLASNGGDLLINQSAQSFKDLIGSEFYVWNEGVSTSAILKNVEDFPNKTEKGESFSMVFETRLRYAKQATYNMFHPRIGNFELFMSEGRSGKRASLVATINRI